MLAGLLLVACGEVDGDGVSASKASELSREAARLRAQLSEANAELRTLRGSLTRGSSQPEGERSRRFLGNVKVRPIRYGASRRSQMAEYSRRHYGKREWRLRNPRLIVQHVAVAPSNDAIFNTFASNAPDPSFGELPNVCAHFAVGDDGEVIQMVPLRVRCRHVVGLNHVAIGIEHVGYSDSDVLNNRVQLRASLRLTAALRCRFKIPVRDVIGHNESLKSRFYRERISKFRGQTHGDFTPASMRIYRRKLRTMRCRS